jgi:hypothetical protein
MAKKTEDLDRLCWHCNTKLLYGGEHDISQSKIKRYPLKKLIKLYKYTQDGCGVTVILRKLWNVLTKLNLKMIKEI